MKYIHLVSLLLIFSCEKNAAWYKCTTTYLTTTGKPKEGCPKLTVGNPVELCHKDTVQIAEYERLNQDSGTSIVDEVIYTYLSITEYKLKLMM